MKMTKRAARLHEILGLAAKRLGRKVNNYTCMAIEDAIVFARGGREFQEVVRWYSDATNLLAHRKRGHLQIWLFDEGLFADEARSLRILWLNMLQTLLEDPEMCPLLLEPEKLLPTDGTAVFAFCG